ncbi:unnamed protein product [Clavelina lepadiformis]|uniref:Uncharacterized protein n=1 Tax=Clavelina lepadiformis TaxID=159417 RepID=A0ABP0EWS2_CLALP
MQFEIYMTAYRCTFPFHGRPGETAKNSIFPVRSKKITQCGNNVSQKAKQQSVNPSLPPKQVKYHTPNPLSLQLTKLSQQKLNSKD